MKKRKFSERIKNITVNKLFDYLILTHIKYALWYFAAYFPIFQNSMSWKVRAKIWRLIGVNIGKNVFIGYGVYLDIGGTSRITIGDNVIITAQSLLLTHKRDLAGYDGTTLHNELPFIEEKIIIEDNVSIGMRSIIMPGVTIGRNSVIGSMAMVSRSVPENVVAVGNPLKIIKKFQNVG